MELDVDALQMLPAEESESLGLDCPATCIKTCRKTCNATCTITS